METETIYVACCRCHRQRVNGIWVENTIPAGAMISHGLCPEDFAKQMREAGVTEEEIAADLAEMKEEG